MASIVGQDHESFSGPDSAVILSIATLPGIYHATVAVTDITAGDVANVYWNNYVLDPDSGGVFTPSHVVALDDTGAVQTYELGPIVVVDTAQLSWDAATVSATVEIDWNVVKIADLT